MSDANAVQKSHVRYFIVSMLFFASTVNYADRAILGQIKGNVSSDLGLDPVWMGYLITAWGWTYVAAQIPSGWLLDRFGSKRVYGAAIFAWSILFFLMGFAGYLHGMAAFVGLCALLLLAGFALAPTFPGNGRFVAAWFPTGERGTASAIFNSSQYFCLVLFGPLVGWITGHFGWKYVFWAMGLIGLAVTPLWFRFMQPPRNHPQVSESELKHIETGGGLVNMDMGAKSGARFNVKWAYIRQLLGSRMLIGVYLGQFCITTLTYFFIQTFPDYLQFRGMSVIKTGFAIALPALCGCIGGVLGGRLSDRLLKRGRTITFARKLPIALGMLIACSMVLCDLVPLSANWLVVTIMCVVLFGKGVGALGWTVVSDTSPKEITGLSGGLFNTFGNTAALTGIVIGYLVKWTGNYTAALVFFDLNALGAVFFYLVVVGEIKRLELKKES